MRRDSTVLLDCKNHTASIARSLLRLGEYDGARNPSGSLQTTRQALTALACMQADLQELAKRFETRIAKGGS